MTPTSPLILTLAQFVLLIHIASPEALDAQSKGSGGTAWPTRGWAKDKPGSVGLDEKVLAAFDAELASGKDALVDSFEVFRCGKVVYESKYSHDYGQIYGKEARTRGPLNAHLTGWYNYFDPAWHPYFNGSDLHSMQSVSKTVSSVILGIAIT